MYINNAFSISPVLKENEFIQNLEDTPTITLSVIEPNYLNDLPRNIIRRMGKATRIGVGAALQIVKHNDKPFDGIIIGTGLGGMEDCIKFLNQIIDYEEGSLTPTNFVQSTPNALAGGLGLMFKNTGYNMTHVGRGGAFEGALMDALLTIQNKDADCLILGSTEEISNYNYNIDRLEEMYKDLPIAPSKLFSSNSKGTLCGEGSVMFDVSNHSEGAKVKVNKLFQISTNDKSTLDEWIAFVLSEVKDHEITDLILGNSGDNRTDFYYDDFAQNFESTNAVVFKHVIGEYPSSTSFGLYLAYRLISDGELPSYLYLNNTSAHSEKKNILIYNQYKGEEHSIIWCSEV